MPTVMPMGPIPPPVDNDDILLVVCWFCWLPLDIVKLGIDVIGLQDFTKVNQTLDKRNRQTSTSRNFRNVQVVE